MAPSEIALPKKTREQQWAVWDSARLNDFKFRPDDIMICTWSKSGTTWMQQILAQLVLNGDPEAYGQALSPWPEFRLMPKEQWFAIAEAQTHRRFIKTHSPLHAIPFRSDVKYIYVGRDVRDVIWSMYHHQTSFTPEAYQAFNSVPGRVGPPLEPPGCDVRAYYHSFLDKNALPGMMADTRYWTSVQEFWDIRNLPNVLLVHYANLKANFGGEVVRIAKFLDIEMSDDLQSKIIDHCSMEHMRKLGRNVESVSMLFDGGIDTFIHKGTNGQWKDVLTPAEIAKADEIAAKNLSPDCAHWLKTGEMPSGEDQMTLKVIGAGFPRTGTLSLKLALEQLGFGPCHHMIEMFLHPESVPLWIAAGKGKPDWDAIFKDYRSCTDAPSFSFWRELSVKYPQAKILLSVRDPEKWFESTQATVLSPQMRGGPVFGDANFQEFFETAVWRGIGERGNDHDFMIDLFQRHIEEVKRTIPKERLLVFDVREGWEPLCKFLGVPVPATPFPKTNSREEMIALREAAGGTGRPLDAQSMAKMARERLAKHQT